MYRGVHSGYRDNFKWVSFGSVVFQIDYFSNTYRDGSHWGGSISHGSFRACFLSNMTRFSHYQVRIISTNSYMLVIKLVAVRVQLFDFRLSTDSGATLVRVMSVLKVLPNIFEKLDVKKCYYYVLPKSYFTSVFICGIVHNISIYFPR